MSATQVLHQSLIEDSHPAFGSRQLLRILAQVLKEFGHLPQRLDDLVAPAVARRHRQPGLAGMAGLPGDGVQQQWPAGQRLAVMVGVGRRTNSVHQS